MIKNETEIIKIKKKNTKLKEIIYNVKNYIFKCHFNNIISSLTFYLLSAINIEYLKNIFSFPRSCFLNSCTDFEMYETLKTLENKDNVLYDIPSKYIHLVSNKIIPLLVYKLNLCMERSLPYIMIYRK